MPPKPRQFHKLNDSALYQVSTRKKLAEVLMCSPQDLKDVLALSVRYKNRWKRKDSDTAPWLTHPPAPDEASNYRPIDIPVPPLKKLQGRIADLLSRVEPPEFLCSPVKGVSYVDNARRHINSHAFWLLDIADYFPNCRADRVAWFFRTKMKCAPDVTTILVALTTDKDRLPQGSPCSPILAYFSNMRMWRDISTLVTNAGCVLSVYADDITISGSKVPGGLVWQIKQTIHKNGFKLKRDKELSLIASPADITGVIVQNGQLKLPNRQRKKLVELVSQQKATSDKKLLAKLDNQIQGRIAQRRQIESVD
ncbi:RNA-directed DNA polymerase [Rhizobium bangladeshense]|uniref:reverse transcriptase family protein n=1 Tax=Rhizobium bangladeshense TaxID=1138189 RepID=UPI001C838F6C|nr:reverse transcriptase family protein [Rhizobium bangladeshense]MBX4882614.1 RNA-directed DNA polymerase [Rhizobium bangladeshense]